VVKFYNKRGTAEQWIKEGKYALKWTRLSCHYFDDNQVRLQLFTEALPEKMVPGNLCRFTVELLVSNGEIMFFESVEGKYEL